MATDDKLQAHIQALAQIATNLMPPSGPVDRGTLKQVINEVFGALAEVQRELRDLKKA